jgi:hypothetical protein
VNVTRNCKIKYQEIKSDDKEMMWKALFLAPIPEKHSHLRTYLIGNSKLTLDDYFEIIYQENHINKKNKNVVLSNHLQVICYKCGNSGHKSNKCRTKRSNYKPGYPKTNGNRAQVNSTNTESNDDNGDDNLQSKEGKQSNKNQVLLNGALTISYTISNVFINKQGIAKYYLDSGASHHMVNNDTNVFNKNMCSQLVNTADGKPHRVNCSGDLIIDGKHGFNIKLQDVIVCNSLSSNFISVPCLDKNGFTIVFKKSAAFIYNQSRIVMKANLTDSGLYELNVSEMLNNQLNNKEVSSINCNLNQLSTMQANAINIYKEDMVLHWHKRLGHISLDKMKKMQDQMNLFISNDYKLKCEICEISKIKRIPFKPIDSKSSQLLELIHTDTSGHIRVNNIHHYTSYIFCS